MTLSPLQLLIVLLVPGALGVAILRSLGVRFLDDRLAFPGWAYLSGCLATGAVMFVWSWARLPFDAAYIGPVLLLLALALYVHGVRRDQGAIHVQEEPTVPLSERWGLVAVVAFLIVVFIQRFLLASQLPVAIADEANIWAMKAKLLFHAGGFGEAFRLHAEALGHHHAFTHPNLNPFLQVWVFAQEGAILHVENRLPIQFFGVALILALAGALRRLLRPGLVLLILPLIANAEPTLAFNRNANSDLMLALGLVVLCDAWLRWRHDGDERWWRLCMLALAFTLWSKSEGLFYLAALALPVALTRIPRLALPAIAVPRRQLAWSLLPVLVVGATWGGNAYFGFQNEILVAKTESSAFVGCASGITAAEDETSFVGVLAAHGPGRIAPVLTHHAGLLLNPAHNGYLFLFFLLLLLLFPRRLLRGEMFVPNLGLLLIFAGYVAVYLATPYEVAWHLRVSAERVIYQALGMTAIALAFSARTLLPSLAPARGRLRIPERPFTAVGAPAVEQTTPASLPPRKRAG